MLHFPMPRAKSLVTTLCFAAAFAGPASIVKADPHLASGLLADQHAPAGVLFDHMHKAGEIMLGLRYAGSFAGATT